MPIQLKDAQGNLVAMTNAQKSQFISDLGITPSVIGAVPSSSVTSTGLALISATDAPAARTALGLGTAATATAASFATAAQLDAVNQVLANKADGNQAISVSADRNLSTTDNNKTLTISAARRVNIITGLGSNFLTHIVNTTGAAVALTVVATGNTVLNGTANATVVRSLPAYGTITLRAVGADAFNLPDITASTTSSPIGVSQVTAYDASNRVSQYVDTGGVTWTVTYNAAGNPSTETGSNGKTRTWNYDASGRFLSITET